MGQYDVWVYLPALPSSRSTGIATAVTAESMVRMLRNLYIATVDVTAVSFMVLILSEGWVIEG